MMVMESEVQELKEEGRKERGRDEAPAWGFRWRLSNKRTAQPNNPRSSLLVDTNDSKGGKREVKVQKRLKLRDNIESNEQTQKKSGKDRGGNAGGGEKLERDR